MALRSHRRRHGLYCCGRKLKYEGRLDMVDRLAEGQFVTPIPLPDGGVLEVWLDGRLLAMFGEENGLAAAPALEVRRRFLRPPVPIRPAPTNREIRQITGLSS